jgi:hypothetical protein
MPPTLPHHTAGGFDPTASPSYLLPALAAVFLGTAVVVPGQFNPLGTLIGIYFLETGIIGLQLLGYSGRVQDAFYGGRPGRRGHRGPPRPQPHPGRLRPAGSYRFWSYRLGHRAIHQGRHRAWPAAGGPPAGWRGGNFF